ncbi:hypothetical protein U27_04252 [Candidatus Vecturithrix granuli]|uniref:DUF3368 domain-containing protein n=1 Tax=Vecturithrix granuli TaxID=1499967 RepID=A0A081BY82_VECG1|nr:hypothetical protein U27_04252 [Candidatus Vecturithrix granuli]
MDLVISDSSVLIHIASIHRISLLKKLFHHLLLPPAVWQEVVEQGGDRAGVNEVRQAQQAGWIEIATPGNILVLKLLKRELDAGEAEVIALALERQATLIFMDEAEGRRVAEVYGLSKTGTVGILIRAKQAGYITSLKTELDNLLHQGHFWIKDTLYSAVLKAVGEDG